jgi:HSP20 family protein
MDTPTKRPMRNILLQPSWYNPIDKFFRNDFLALWNGNIPETLPSVNIKNEKENYRIEMAAPGLRKEDFQIDIDGGSLTISCEKENEPNEEKDGEGFFRREYNYSTFSRRLPLPENLDMDRIAAKYTNGILNVSIPKKNGTTGSRNFKIKIE